MHQILLVLLPPNNQHSKLLLPLQVLRNLSHLQDHRVHLASQLLILPPNLRQAVLDSRKQ